MTRRVPEPGEGGELLERFVGAYRLALERWHARPGAADVEASQRDIAALAFMGVGLALAGDRRTPRGDPRALDAGAARWLTRGMRWAAPAGEPAAFESRLAWALTGPLAPLAGASPRAPRDESMLDELAVTLITPFDFAPGPSGTSITPAEIVRAFEAATPGEDRAREGMFYTPPPVVRFMVRRAFTQALQASSGVSATDLDQLLIDPDTLLDLDPQRLLARLDGLRLLDPACGGGEFLLEAADLLLRLEARCGRPPNRRGRPLAHWRGWDARDTSARLARARLALLLHAHGARELDVTSVIRTGDALLEERSAASFDLVAGNPPYVRQEAIAARKEDLGRAIQALDPALPPLDLRSDLFLYFMLHGLACLKPGGHLIFITSNSWLDVGYAAPLRAWMPDHVHLVEVIEDQAQKTFRSADINTVISLIARTAPAPSDATRFVAVRGPVPGIDRIPWDRLRETNADLHVREVPTSALRSRAATDRWGGLHLRSPDLFEELRECLAARLVRLGDVAEVRFGVKTGANQFFFMPLDEVRGQGLEEHFRPAMLNSRDLRRIDVHPGDFRHGLLLCEEALDTLPVPLRRRVHEAERLQVPARRTLRGKDPWYSLGTPRSARIHCNYQIDRTMSFFVGREPHLASNNFMKIHDRGSPYALAASLNSSWTQLFVAVTGRTNFGGGLLKIETFEIADLPIIDPALLDETTCTDLITSGARLELASRERRDLDHYVLGACGLDPREIERLEGALAELYQQRTSRARGKARPRARAPA